MNKIRMYGDIGNKCVSCNQDTAFGSGKFVNRIPADADYQTLDKQGHTIFAEGEYRDGYLCPDCNTFECDRCDKLISGDGDVCPYDVYGKEDRDDFLDGAYRVHLECLTKEELQQLKEQE